MATRFTTITVALCLSGAASAQSGGAYEIIWSTIDAGGGASAGGAYTLRGTIGQHDAADPSAAADYVLEPGFWPGVPFLAACNDADLAGPFGLLDLADITAFVQAFMAQDPAADFDGNGLFDLDDVVAFVTVFTAGCP